MLWSWGVTAKPRAPPPRLLPAPCPALCCAVASAAGAPQRGHRGLCVCLPRVTCVLSFSPVISMRCMVQFVGREAKYRWVILLGTDGRGLVTFQSLPGQAVLGQSLPLFCPSSNVLTSGEHGGFHRLCPGAFSLSLVRAAQDEPGCPAVGWIWNADSRADSATWD